MEKLNKKNLLLQLKSLTVFKNLLKTDLFVGLAKFLASENLEEEIENYSNFVSIIYNGCLNGGLCNYLLTLCCQDENVYVVLKGKGEKISPFIEESVGRELEILNFVAHLKPENFISAVNYNGYLPKFEQQKVDFISEYYSYVENIKKRGYGIYAKYHSFYVGDNHAIIPVKNPDKISLSQLIDYNDEREKVVNNTLALLENKPSQNVLLTGEAGTGKSSTIKAIVNKFYSQGLRIIEVRKNQLSIIPGLLDSLAENPLKFILFIDDLSFTTGDDNYNALKAVLEGSVSTKSSNVVIYATSNRRHIVRESFSERTGDEIHLNDTLSEVLSLSERFGLHVYFGKPSKQTYLKIVHALCKEKGVEMDKEKIELLAERYALERGARSARLAKQFVESLLCG